MNNVEIEVASCSTFMISDLSITPELVGASLTFEYNSARVTIALPSSEHHLHPDVSEKVDDQYVVASYGVDSVDIIVFLGATARLPQSFIRQDGHLNGHLSEHLKGDPYVHLLQDIHRKIGRHHEIAKEVFDAWIRILRWKHRHGALGRPEIRTPDARFPVDLIVATTREQIHSTQSFQVEIGRPVTLQEWNEVNDALMKGVQSPIYYDLMFDGVEHLKMSDFQRATFDFAIACETFLRLVVNHHLPDTLPTAVSKYIDQVPLRTILNEVVPDMFNDADKARFLTIKSDLHKLFDARNDIAHSGHSENATQERCQLFLETTRKLIALEAGLLPDL